MASARAAYIAGFATTSNLAAGERWGVPTTGTAAHAFTLVHDDEATAFATQVEALGRDTTLLVDTYDVEQGIRTAVAAAGVELGAIRLDSEGAVMPGWDPEGSRAMTEVVKSPGIMVTDDGRGGAFLAWWDLRGGDYHLYASRLDASGRLAEGWPETATPGGAA